MTDIIVLVKLVADVDHIPPDAWDLEAGTLRRGRLRMVSNPLDDRALRAATECARATGGRVFVLSMGPRAAEHACRRAIAYGADEATLLSDSAFAGADTLATARVLAAAIRRIQHDHDVVDPLIFAGMQSPDGDTAQVPAAVAALLGMPLLPYVSAFRARPADGSAEIELLQRRGRARVRIAGGPLVLTFTGLAAQLPFATSLHAMIGGSQAAVQRWGAAELKIDASLTGLAGSATRVVEIQSVAHSTDHGHVVNLQESADSPRAVGELVRRVSEDLATSARRPSNDDRPAEGNRRPDATPHGAIWTYIERDEPGSLEILGEARRLADELGVHSIAVLARQPDDELARALATHGATGILVVQGAPTEASCIAGNAIADLLLHHRDAALIAAAARIRRPRTILIAATLHGRAVSALAAALLGAGLTADCTGLALEPVEADDTNDGGNRTRPASQPPALLQIRPALGGNILATIVSTARTSGLPEMATVRSGVFPLREYAVPGPGARGLPETETVLLADSEPTRVPVGVIGDVTPVEAKQAGGAGVDPEARIIVAVGAGIGSEERLIRYVTPLLETLGRSLETTTSLACSRAVVDAGILPYEYQIGQTGKSVRPELYVALGISGAIQHRLGMEHSARVLSVNPDPEAPIHALSDYAIVGTIEDAVPLLLEALGSTIVPARGTSES